MCYSIVVCHLLYSYSCLRQQPKVSTQWRQVHVSSCSTPTLKAGPGPSILLLLRAHHSFRSSNNCNNNNTTGDSTSGGDNCITKLPAAAAVTELVGGSSRHGRRKVVVVVNLKTTSNNTYFTIVVVVGVRVNHRRRLFGETQCVLGSGIRGDPSLSLFRRQSERPLHRCCFTVDFLAVTTMTLL
jgi:hypothetical protein